jgi:hypothetical protein
MAIDVASLMSITSLEELAELQDTSVAKIHPIPSKNSSCVQRWQPFN